MKSSQNVNRNIKQYVVLALILTVAALFRFYGLYWDSGYLFHPDERKIVLVASQLALPQNVLQFFSSESPLNPKFFAYGSFPIYLLRGLSALAPAMSFGIPWREDSFVALGMLGRVLSGVFDLGTLVVLFLLARRLYNSRVALIACALLAVTVLDIQLAHFYAVDTVLTFLVIATLYVAARYASSGNSIDFVTMSLLFGLALATKVTAAPLIIPLAIAVLQVNRPSHKKPPEPGIEVEPRLRPALDAALPDGASNLALSQATLATSVSRGFTRIPILGRGVLVARRWASDVWDVRRTLLKLIGLALLVFLITQPYVLLDPIRYFGQVGTELLVARGWLDYPYTRQYTGTLPFIYQIAQSSIWGMGLPLGIFAWVGGALFTHQWWRGRRSNDLLVLAWGLAYMLSIGGQHAKYLRYVLPLMPFLLLMATVAFMRLWENRRPLVRAAVPVALVLVGLSGLAYSVAFDSLYTREHPWLQVSRWMYQNIPAHATIATEHWDDLLPAPMTLNGTQHLPTDYSIKQLPMYDPDDEHKVQTIVDTLSDSEYIVLASQRLYTTIPRLPARYPISSRYYQLLFSGKLGYELVAFARNDLTLGNIVIQNDTFSDSGLAVPPLLQQSEPGKIVLNWGKADESFVVYDHPMPLVFKKFRALSADELRTLLLAP